VIIRLVLRRLVTMVFVLLGISLITFLLSHIVPADPARLFAGPRASAETIRLIRHQYGLDQPVWQQYVHYVGNLLHGDFGYSLFSHRNVSDDLSDYLPATVELTLVALLFILVVGIPLGIVSAVWRGSPLDQLSRILSTTGVAMPAFWLGLMLQLLLYAKLGWFPAGGRLDSNSVPPPRVTGLYLVDSLLAGNVHLFWQSVWHIALPAAVLGYSSLAVITRQMRGSMLEVLPRDFIRTARAKGLLPRRVVLRHAAVNALLPVITVTGLQVGVLLGGALLVEDVFSWPGIGRYATLATLNLDYNAIMAVTLVAAFIYVLVNLLVDILYAVVDPEVTY
jgi:peptide/nickel transport system permease protein